MADPADLADRFYRRLRQRMATGDAPEVVELFREVYERIHAIFRAPDVSGKDAMLAALVAGLTDDLPHYEFGIAANVCGLGVELGANAGLPLDAILARLPVQFAGCEPLAEKLVARFGQANLDIVDEKIWNDAANTTPEDRDIVRDFLALKMTGTAAMAILSLSPALRDRGRARPGLMAAAHAARPFNPYAFYVSALLETTDGEDVVVLDLQRGIGFRVRLMAIRNCFHLATLLQAALLSHPAYADWPGPKLRPGVVRVAKGEQLVTDVPQEQWQAEGAFVDGRLYDAAAMCFYQWPALLPDGTLQTEEKARPYPPWWAWGESKPTELLDLDGVRLVLVSALESPATWDLNFFAPLHPALRSSVEIQRELGAESVRGWIEQIRAVPRQAPVE